MTGIKDQKSPYRYVVNSHDGEFTLRSSGDTLTWPNKIEILVKLLLMVFPFKFLPNINKDVN